MAPVLYIVTSYWILRCIIMFKTLIPCAKSKKYVNSIYAFSFLLTVPKIFLGFRIVFSTYAYVYSVEWQEMIKCFWNGSILLNAFYFVFCLDWAQDEVELSSVGSDGDSL